MAQLAAKAMPCIAVTDARWGRVTSLMLPGGSELGLYQPWHPPAIDL